MTTAPYLPGDTQVEVVTALTNAQTVNDSLVATGATQANALPLVLGPRWYRVSGGGAGAGVMLPSLAAVLAGNPNAGANTPWCIICNSQAVALLVYGSSASGAGDTVNSIVTTTGFSVPAGKSVLVFANKVTPAGNWNTLLSA